MVPIPAPRVARRDPLGGAWTCQVLTGRRTTGCSRTLCKVADPFHVIRLANQRLDEVRRRVQNETLGHRGRKDDPLYRIRRLLTAAHERISDRGQTRLRGLLDAGDPHSEVRTAWHAKETVRGIYGVDSPALALRYTVGLADDLQDESCPPEINKLGRTIARWTPQITNWHISKVTNGPTEALNNLIKRIKRIAFGLPQLRELPNPGTPLRGETQLGPIGHRHSPLKSDEPLYIHPYFGARSRVAPEVAKYALRKGVDPQKINMCHMDGNMTLDYQRRVADLEVFISFDNFGLEIYYDSLEFNYNSHDSQRHDHLLKLLDLGYGDQILVSQDVCYKAQLTLYGGFGYAHILRNIVPALRYAGVDDDTLDLILVRNPFRLLSY